MARYNKTQSLLLAYFKAATERLLADSSLLMLPRSTIFNLSYLYFSIKFCQIYQTLDLKQHCHRIFSAMYVGIKTTRQSEQMVLTVFAMLWLGWRSFPAAQPSPDWREAGANYQCDELCYLWDVCHHRHLHLQCVGARKLLVVLASAAGHKIISHPPTIVNTGHSSQDQWAFSLNT